MIEKVAIARSGGANMDEFVRMTNYQADPLAATLKSRTLGLQDLSVTKQQLEADN